MAHHGGGGHMGGGGGHVEHHEEHHEEHHVEHREERFNPAPLGVHVGVGPGHIAPELHMAPHFEGPHVGVGVGVALAPGFQIGVGVGFNPHPGFVIGPNRTFRRCTYGGNFGLIRRCPLRLAIGRRVVLPLTFGMPLTDIMIIYDPRIGTYRCAEEFDIAPCAFNQHIILQLKEYTEITFQDPMTMQTRIYYADSYCSVCGQHFFIEQETVVAGPMVTPVVAVNTPVVVENTGGCNCC